MSINEFRAWLEGFMASVNGVPTKEQWDIILERISRIRSWEAPMNTRNIPNISALSPQVGQLYWGNYSNLCKST